MKKRVRVYQRGGFNAFDAPVMPPMRVAQNGVNVQQPQYSDEQLVSAVMSIIGEQGGSPEDALQQLVSAGIDQNKANAVVSSAIEYINQQGAGQQQAQQQGPSEEEQAQAEEEARAQEQQQEEADRQARYNAEMANDEADLADSDADIDQFASDYIMRNGGSLPSKRTFVKNVMKLTKKAAGGQGEPGKADDTDIPGGRQAGLQAFVGDLKTKSNSYLQEQDLKAMHDMYSEQMNTPYTDPNSYMQEPEMQFGGMRPGQQRRMERRANRMAGQIPSAFFNAQQQMFPQGINIMGMPSMPSMMPGMGSRGMQSYQMPSRGLYEGGPRLANIEVHKTGLFGRPKQWTATFDNSRGYDPDQWMRDMARMNQVNQQTEYEDVNFDHSEEATNTSTAENAEVAKTEAETQTNGGDGTGGTKPKPDTGDDVNEEVDERSGKKPAGDIPKIDIYEPWKGAMQDQFDLKYSKPYVAYVDSKGNVLPDKKGSVGTKQYYYNSRTNKWSNIDGDINDKDRLARLNNWKKTERLHPGHAGTESTSERLMSKPQSAMADDEFITNAVMSGVGIPAALRMAVPGMINIGKPTEQLPPGNNQGLSGAGVPPSVKQALGPGANPRLLGTGKAPNVPSPPTSYGMKPTISDMGSNRMFEPESKQVEKSAPVKLKIEGEAVFKLKSGDTKSHFVNKNGKIYKTSKLGDESQWYEIKDPERVQNIIALSGRSEDAFNLSKPKTSTPQPKVNGPGLSDLGMNFPEPNTEKSKVSAKENLEINRSLSANGTLPGIEMNTYIPFQSYHNAYEKGPGNTLVFNGAKVEQTGGEGKENWPGMNTSTIADHREYIVRNGKVYTGRFNVDVASTGDFNYTDWYEVTDPQRIKTIKTAMKKDGYRESLNSNTSSKQSTNANLSDLGKTNIPVKDKADYGNTGHGVGDYTFMLGDEEKYFADDRPNITGTADWQMYSYNEDDGSFYKELPNNMKVRITDPNLIEKLKAEGKGAGFETAPWTRQFGGMTDQQSELYRFMGGGEDMSIPTLNERNTADPYFAYGGYFDGGGEYAKTNCWNGNCFPSAKDANGNPIYGRTNSTQTSSKPGMVAVNDANGNRKYVTEDEADAWNSALKDNADLSLKDMSWASESPRQNPNYKTWDDLKDKGVNVGDFREGIDYSRMGQPKRDNLTPRPGEPGYNQLGYNNPYMYNPQIGAMYPPLFGGRRRFGPPGGVGYAGSWLKQQGMPFDPRTGQMLGQMPTDLPLTKLDVTKSSLLRKRPKEYTMYFGNYGQLGDNLPKGTPGTEGAMGSEEKDYSKRNKFAEGLMHTPGLRKLGAKLYKQPNQPLPEGTTYTEEQMPSLPLRPIGNIPTGDLVPDQYNNANQPGLSGIDMTGLPDSPIPEITPEEFSFEDQQRFGNVQGPLNQTESTGIGQLPMRSLSNIPTQYDDQLMANNFNYSPEGLPKAADIDALQRFIPQPQGAITEEDYANQLDLLGFPDNTPVMRDINGNAIQPGQGTPMNIAGPMSDMSNLPDEQGYFNDLQLEQNQEQRIAGLPPESASYDYYQDVMQPNRDQSMYPMGFPEGITPDEYGQYAQESLEGFDPMRLPSESNSAPEPWMTQDMVNAQQAQIRAEQQRRMQEQQRIRAQREAQERAETQSQESNAGKTQQVKPVKVNSKGVENYGTNLNYDNINAIQSKLYRQGWNWDEIGAAFDEETGVWDPAKAEKFRKESRVFMDEARKQDEYNRSPEGISKNKKEQRKLETKEIKSYGVPEYANYQTKNDLFKAMQAGHVKTPSQKGATGNELRRLGSEYENWLITQDPTKLRREGGQALPKAQFGPTTGRLTTNPDLVGFSDIDLLNSQTYPEVSGSVNNATGDWWSASPNMPTVQDTGMTQPDEMTVDPNQQYTHQMKREYDPRGAAVKFKVKDMYNVDFEKGVNQVNAGINFGLGALGEVGDRDRRAQMFNNLNSGIYGSTKALKRGTYEANSGLLEPDKKGFKGVVRQGGNIKRQGGPAYKTGGVTYMSADQVKKFLAEGGELEFV